MSKLTISASSEQLPELMNFIENEFHTKPFAAAILDTMKEATKEIVNAVINAGDIYSCIHTDVSITKEGCCIQLLYPGPIFNPCSKNKTLCPFTLKEMDEISFEFKYGHSVVAIYKKI